jgi:hypothetical protein
MQAEETPELTIDGAEVLQSYFESLIHEPSKIGPEALWTLLMPSRLRILDEFRGRFRDTSTLP